MASIFSLITYSSKSILKNPGRNTFLVGIIVLMSVSSLFTASLFEGKNKQIRQAIIKTHTGNWQIFNKKFYTEDNPLNVTILDESLKRSLKDYHYSPEIVLNSTLLHPDSPLPITILGIEQRLHEKLFPLEKFLIQGQLFSERLDESPEVLIGEELSKNLNLSVGDTVLVAYLDTNGSLLNESLTIQGIYRQFGPDFESLTLFMPKDRLISMLGLRSEDFFNRIVVLPNKSHKNPDILSENLLVKKWNDLNPELFTLMKFHDGIIIFLMIFMLLISLSSLSTPLNVIWDDRTSELKMLTTLGASKTHLSGLALFESIFLFLSSLFFSLIIFAGLYHWSSRHGISFAAFGGNSIIRGGVQIENIVYPAVNPLHVYVMIIFNLLVIFGGNLWCVRQRLKVNT